MPKNIYKDFYKQIRNVGTDTPKVGDIVELLPNNNRNRQLRSQENKHIWEVLTVDTPIYLKGDMGFLIKHVGSNHTRWVTTEDIKIHEFRENTYDVC